MLLIAQEHVMIMLSSLFTLDHKPTDAKHTWGKSSLVVNHSMNSLRLPQRSSLTISQVSLNPMKVIIIITYMLFTYFLSLKLFTFYIFSFIIFHGRTE